MTQRKEFVNMVKKYGFKKAGANSRMIINHHEIWDAELFYREDGLILWAEYARGGKDVTFKIYGELVSREKINTYEEKNPFGDKPFVNIDITTYLNEAMDCAMYLPSRGALYDLLKYGTMTFTCDSFYQLEKLESKWDFASVWKQNHFVWFTHTSEKNRETKNRQMFLSACPTAKNIMKKTFEIKRIA